MKKEWLQVAWPVLLAAFLLAGCGGRDTAVEGVDLDLKKSKGNTLYSEIYHIKTEPAGYVGKVIRLEGLLSTYYDEKAGRDRYFCQVPDAAGCCWTGLEFVPAEAESGSQECAVPENGSTVTVSGTLQLVDENGLQTPELREASVAK